MKGMRVGRTLVLIVIGLVLGGVILAPWTLFMSNDVSADVVLPIGNGVRHLTFQCGSVIHPSRTVVPEALQSTALPGEEQSMEDKCREKFDTWRNVAIVWIVLSVASWVWLIAAMRRQQMSLSAMWDEAIEWSKSQA